MITGASSGIGAAFARLLAERGYGLILVARRRERLERLAAELPVEAEALVADLSLREDRRKLAARLRSEERLALLVNNAGFGTRNRFWEAELEGQTRMHEVHVMAVAELTHAALGNLVRQGAGGIINVASVAAFSRSPGNASYCATKSWMVAFTEGLALDLGSMGSGVKVQALCPGFTYTEFHDVMGVSRDRIARILWMHSEDVARRSLEGLDKGELIVTPGWGYRMFTAIFPRLPLKLRMALEARSPHTRGRL